VIQIEGRASSASILLFLRKRRALTLRGVEALRFGAANQLLSCPLVV
jgi:hypothetical protein